MRNRFFNSLLVGATGRDRALAALAAAIGITLIALGGTLVDGPLHTESWLFVPIGASAVLVFVVPASPLAQPWPVIGGLVISAAVGILFGVVIGHAALAIGLALGLAIGVMSLARCLHPPGGAAAIAAAIGAPAGFSFEMLRPLLLIGFDAIAVVLVGWALHRLLTGHSYPHVPPRVLDDPEHPGDFVVGFGPQDVDAVLSHLDDSFDIGRGDLEAILRAVELEAQHRQEAGGQPTRP